MRNMITYEAFLKRYRKNVFTNLPFFTMDVEYNIDALTLDEYKEFVYDAMEVLSEATKVRSLRNARMVEEARDAAAMISRNNPEKGEAWKYAVGKYKVFQLLKG